MRKVLRVSESRRLLKPALLAAAEAAVGELDLVNVTGAVTADELVGLVHDHGAEVLLADPIRRTVLEEAAPRIAAAIYVPDFTEASVGYRPGTTTQRSGWKAF